MRVFEYVRKIRKIKRSKKRTEEVKRVWWAGYDFQPNMKGAISL